MFSTSDMHPAITRFVGVAERVYMRILHMQQDRNVKFTHIITV